MKKRDRELSILEEGITVKGDVAFAGRLVIRGRFEGTLEGDRLVVARQGRVRADVHAADVVLGGGYDGRLQADGTVVILSTGSCSGTVVCSRLVVDAGGALDAEIRCRRPEAEGEEVSRETGEGRG